MEGEEEGGAIDGEGHEKAERLFGEGHHVHAGHRVSGAQAVGVGPLYLSDGWFAEARSTARPGLRGGSGKTGGPSHSAGR